MPRKQNLKIKVGLNLQRSSNNRIFFFHMPCIVGVLRWMRLSLEKLTNIHAAGAAQISGDNNCLDYDLPVEKPVASEGSAGDQKLCCRGCRRCDSRSWRDYKCVGGGLCPSTTPIEQ
ncbi:hypothetical protein F2Q69_00057190 [Brassica cretica]|uniref:Uncharacterized protein n=1 Tax=Brassica cretica TaxID=69181 RepID=A0A8S9N2F2_BRACR|nr:hypothetical protein F2Q69_00057190 [Brassica cretica]